MGHPFFLQEIPTNEWKQATFCWKGGHDGTVIF